jgi:protein-disulfide isomerase
MTKNGLLAALIIFSGLGLACAPTEAPLASRTTRNADGTTTIDIAGMPIQGADNTSVVIIEFSDYECPYCARHTTTVYPELRDRFISTGKVQYVFANFPLPNHPNAKPLAAAAICAGKQDVYWKMHDELFKNRPRTTEAVLNLGRQIGLQMEPFGQCLGDDGPQAERIRIDQQIAQEFQISGTPSFILGVIDAQGKVVARDIIVGAHPLPRFEASIAKLLNP